MGVPQVEMLREIKKRAIKEFHIEVRGKMQHTMPCNPPPLHQWPLFTARLKYIICGALFQYVHGMFTQLAHRLHAPQKQPLPDLGFSLLPVCGCLFLCGAHTQRCLHINVSRNWARSRNG